VTDVRFNPLDGNSIVSIAKEDGIYFWQFHGDTQTNFLPETDQDEET